MPRRFDDDPSDRARALQIWRLLIGKAEKVFGFDWYGIYPPTPDQLDEAYRAQKA